MWNVVQITIFKPAALQVLLLGGTVVSSFLTAYCSFVATQKLLCSYLLLSLSMLLKNIY